MECKRIYFDTNIVLDLLDPSRVQSKDSIELWKLVAIHEIDIVISEDMLSTIFYIHKNKQQVLDLFRNIQKKWIISPFGKEVISQAIEISLDKNLDFEDILQCLCAKENTCDLFISNDCSFFDCGIKVIDTQTFLQEMKIDEQ